VDDEDDDLLYLLLLLRFDFCFRFDCGSGMGVVRTKNRIVVGDWNHLRVRRREWKGFVQLNDGPETGTLSKVRSRDIGGGDVSFPRAISC